MFKNFVDMFDKPPTVVSLTFVILSVILILSATLTIGLLVNPIFLPAPFVTVWLICAYLIYKGKY